MIQRIITGVIGISVIIPLFIFSNTVAFTIVIALATVMCLYEMFRCMGIHKKYAITMPAYTLAAAIPFFLRYLGDNPYSRLRTLRGYSWACCVLSCSPR